MPAEIIFPGPDFKCFNTKCPIDGAYLKTSDLKTLYKIIDEKQAEHRDSFLASIFIMDGESQDDFIARSHKLYNCFVTSVSIKGINDEVISGNSEQFFDSPSIPERIKNVTYQTHIVPQAILKYLPSDRIVVSLDFSRPPLLDFSKLPTLPTPNDSYFELVANNESWFASTKAKLEQFFCNRQPAHCWIHREAIYDILLIFIGIPLSIWATWKTSSRFPSINNLHIFISSSIYIYTFIISLTIFRVLFSYARWLFPKVELLSSVTARQSKHRYYLTAIVLSIAASFVWDMLKLLW